MPFGHQPGTAGQGGCSQWRAWRSRKELRLILAHPFAAWRAFLHPSQHEIAYRVSYSGSAQVTGGPGTGKTVTVLHRAAILAERAGQPRLPGPVLLRTGRGRPLTKAQRSQVWQVAQQVTTELATARQSTHFQLANEATQLLRQPGTPRYRHILVDEAQDLHPAQWRLLRAAVDPGPDDLFIAADPHQRIYDNRVRAGTLRPVRRLHQGPGSPPRLRHRRAEPVPAARRGRAGPAPPLTRSRSDAVPDDVRGAGAARWASIVTLRAGGRASGTPRRSGSAGR